MVSPNATEINSDSNSHVRVLEKMDLYQENYNSDLDPAYEESEMSSSDSEDDFKKSECKETLSVDQTGSVPLKAYQQSEGPTECNTLAVPAALRYTGIKSRMANVTVPVYASNEGQKNYTRLDYCYFCEKCIKSRVSRHYTEVHADQQAVKEILKCSGKERQNKLFSLQNLGNLKHNTKVLSAGEGELVVVKRPAKPTLASNVLHCTFCYGFYADKSLKTHVNSCSAGKAANKDSHSIAASKVYIKSLLNASTDDDKDFQELLEGLTETKANPGLVKLIRNDETIAAFAKGLLLQLGERELRRPGAKDISNIRSKVRSVSRLLAVARNSSRQLLYNQMLLPSNFDLLLQSARKISKTCPQTGSTIGGFVKQMNLHVISKAINNNDSD